MTLLLSPCAAKSIGSKLWIMSIRRDDRPGTIEQSMAVVYGDTPEKCKARAEVVLKALCEAEGPQETQGGAR